MALLDQLEPVSFDGSKAYKQWEVDGKYFGDGREAALLDYVYGRADADGLRGNPDGVLAAIDAFARSVTGLINIGETKGVLVSSAILRHKPAVVLELGGYIGYSAIMFGSAVREAGGRRYYSVEASPLFAAVAASLVDLAGLRDTVRVVVGTGAEAVARLHAEGALAGGALGMVFLDHHKPSYVTDLKLCERLGLVGRGTVLVADNMMLPGNPPYAAWVRASVAEKRRLDRAAADRGNPDLVYESRLFESFEPSGMVDALEITECMGVDSASG